MLKNRGRFSGEVGLSPIDSNGQPQLEPCYSREALYQRLCHIILMGAFQYLDNCMGRIAQHGV